MAFFSGLNQTRGSIPEAGCQAVFEYEAYTGPIPSVTGISFQNLSTGNYTELFWDFGDGNYSSSSASSIDHFYDDFGFYDVCLTIYGGDCGVEEYCINLFVGDESMKCDYTDCVYPGDANGDGKADMYDLLHIGVGLESAGPERPDATTDWVGQPADDWDTFTADGINYKHLDCDGNGLIETSDFDAVHSNYSLMDDSGLVFEDNGAPVRLMFDADTIFLGNVIPEKIFLTGRILAGSPDMPFDHLHGLAFYIQYDSDFFQDELIDVQYQSSFLGASAEMAIGFEDNRPAGQLDVAMTSLEKKNKKGQGLVATVTYIIVGDIIGAREEPDVPVEFYLKGVKGVDSVGIPQTIQIPEQPIVIIFKKEDVVSSGTPEVSVALQAFPNPASSRLFIEQTLITGGTYSIYDAIGQKILSVPADNHMQEIDIRQLNAGLYTLVLDYGTKQIRKKIVIQ